MEKLYTDEEIEALWKRAKELSEFPILDRDSLNGMTKEERCRNLLELQERTEELQEINDKLEADTAQKEALTRELKAEARMLKRESEALLEEAFGGSPIDYRLFDDIKAANGGTAKKRRKGKLRVKR